ncbi:LytR/AlgR family response regulator transcription factor [Anaerocolumna xylanovorans]|uniref:Stage 0 sporulation protein A homolog n=1 Tax=Anaerocolumna xylanovorans DSM 12503 TaxID=1121345 RepID=A0A1M7Y911_9FIRM|nr:LytTR family DNA-binding domain-containing protein [Anaerocolumna xylanovorans]SHO49122.1 two component transcriptional regulator, LytTR family [Anaerocolumna xylanovorans DSM 12503]
MLKIAICDDIKEYNKNMEKYIMRYGQENHVEVKIQSYCSGEYLLMFYHKKKYDIIFLDFEMPEMNGLEVAKKIREIDNQVSLIFCTAYFTLPNIQSGYDVEATDFLKKPVFYKKLETILSNIYHRKLTNKEEKLVIKNKDGIFTIQISDIIFIETINKNILIHTTKEKIYCYKKMYDFENILVNQRFYRCHNSYLLNLDYIDKLTDSSAILTTGHIVSVSKYKRKQLIKKIAEFLGESV